MKMPSRFALIFSLLVVSVTTQAQSASPIDQITRPRVVGATQTASTKAKSQDPAQPRPAPARPQESPEKSPEKSPAVNQQKPEESRPVAREESKVLSPNRLRTRINEATRLMKARPVPTALTPSLEYVTLAALLPETSQIHLIRISKQTFLAKGSEVSAVSTLVA